MKEFEIAVLKAITLLMARDFEKDAAVAVVNSFT